MDSLQVLHLINSVNELNNTIIQVFSAALGAICALFLWWRLFY